MRLLKSLLAITLVGIYTLAQAQSSPVDMLDQAAHQVLNVLKTHQSELKSKPQIVQNAVEKYLLPHIDIAGMSRSVLGRDVWMKASAAEKAAFSRAFTQLVMRTYGTSLSKYQGETIKFYPLRGDAQGKFVQVQSEIIRPSGPPLPLNYSMISKNGEWKVYDLTVEGISLLQSYRSQFENALQRSSLSELTQQLQHNKKVVS
jgi:phospholipid transport system substrate-binding protein